MTTKAETRNDAAERLRLCKELYGAREGQTYTEIMAKAKVCHRPARFAITIPGFATIYRCGIHAKGYRLADNRVVPW